MKYRSIVLILLISTLFSGCGAGRTLILTGARPTFHDLMTSVMQETDVDIARSAMAADLKIVEGLLLQSPNDRFLLTLAAQGFAGYAMLFYEPNEPEKAKSLYRRSMDYGIRAICIRAPQFQNRSGRYQDFEKAVEKLTSDDVAAVYWTAYAWSSWINLSRTDPIAFAEFPRVRLLMDWVRWQDENYFFSGVNWFDGVYYSTLPPILGGDPEKSREYFERAMESTQGSFLLGKLYYAQTYAVQTMNRELFEKLLTEIIDDRSVGNADANLANAVAKIRAKHLLEQIDELF